MELADASFRDMRFTWVRRGMRSIVRKIKRKLGLGIRKIKKRKSYQRMLKVGREGGMLDYQAFKEKEYDKLADTLREYLNMEEIYGMLREADLD